ncbi:hypothetical protein BDF20DRAFT_848130 [Mycotypha africana]|uniref:uncharacterized protein n=1 Tax=Mycotypha africana TaxID=64632 RepID=UPI0023016298|nr:uncharacterized protein BDF20DRAFT_848130 [Mycotypha africana]KAI8992084.1 hypothetical protein BDF20DRAFT_848130 [Mycotypha africana]
MGKSLRSQQKKRTRAIKRQQVFKPVEDARLERLAKAQAEAVTKPSVGDYMEDTTKDNSVTTNPTDTTSTSGAVAMVTDEAEQTTTKKISTSGPRSNRHARKLREKKKKGKKGTNKF